MSSKNTESIKVGEYEKSKIKALAAERQAVQKKTFTKWMNTFLLKVSLRTKDLYVDVADGTLIMRLLEVLSGERVGKPSRGKMKIHFVQNMNMVLTYLKAKNVKLENIGANDIIDGNPTIILGLIWTIILRFQIQGVTIETEGGKQSSARASAKDALLMWCKLKIINYTNVKITNFTTSWRNGLAFNAIIHKQRPDLFDFNQLNPDNCRENLIHAFNVAEAEFGIAPLLDPEDVDVDYPDEKSIMTYLASFYHCFSKMKAENVQERRIGKVVIEIMGNHKMMDDYDTLASNLLEWIIKTIALLNLRNFGNTLSDVHQQVVQFTTYRTTEKKTKFVEKGNLEEKLFTLQSRLRSNNQKPFIPKEKKSINEINRSWGELEKVEHGRELALRQELRRQEKLLQMATKFDKKAGMRSQWLMDTYRLLSDQDFGRTLPEVEASVKKHEAIETEVGAYKERVQVIEDIADVLKSENYHDADRIQKKIFDVQESWNNLLEAMTDRRERIDHQLRLQRLLREMLDFSDWISEMKDRLCTDDHGLEFHDVENHLQKHNLLEGEIGANEEPIQCAIANAEAYEQPEDDFDEGVQIELEEKAADLGRGYEEVCELARNRRSYLEKCLYLLRFRFDVQQERRWIGEEEKSLLLADVERAKDYVSLTILSRKYQLLDEEINGHSPVVQDVIKVGKNIVASDQYDSPTAEADVDELEKDWNSLVDLKEKRKQRLTELLALQQFLLEADNIEAWINLNTGLISIDNYGADEAKVNNLLNTSADLEAEIKDYEKNIEQLEATASNLAPEDLSSDQVVEKNYIIRKNYQQLVEQIQSRRARLIDMLAYFRFATEAEILISWVTERTAIVDSVESSPNDLAEAEIISQRFSGIEKEIKVNEDRLSKIKENGTCLIENGNSNLNLAQEKLNNLEEAWTKLEGATVQKREAIDKKMQLLILQSEIVEIRRWTIQKIVVLKKQSVTDDPDAVIDQQRKLGAVERESAAIAERMEAVDASPVLAQLIEENPEQAMLLQDQFQDLHNVWDDLQDKANEQRANIGDCSDYQKLLIDIDDCEAWARGQRALLASELTANSIAESEKLQKEHQDLADDLIVHEASLDSITEMAKPYMEDDSNGEHLSHHLNELHEEYSELHELSEKRKLLLMHNYEQLLFRRDCKQIEGLLSKQDLFLSNAVSEIGIGRKPSKASKFKKFVKSLIDKERQKKVDLYTLIELSRRHKEQLRNVDVCSEKVQELKGFARRLSVKGHSAADKLLGKSDSLEKRLNENQIKFSETTVYMQMALDLQQFYQQCDELNERINEKRILASDQVNLDPVTLSGKLKQHETFEAELVATKEQLDNLDTVGKNLIVEQPEAATEIEPRLSELQDQWQTLCQATADKGQLLKDSNNTVQLRRNMAELEKWIDDNQNAIAATDIGKDLATCNNLLQKHTALESDIATHMNRLELLSKQIEDFVGAGHNDGDVMQERYNTIADKFERLTESSRQRRKALEASRSGYQFFRDIDDESQWIYQKKQQLNFPYVISNLIQARNMKASQLKLKSDLAVHQSILEGIEETGQQLIEENLLPTEEIENKLNFVKKEWAELRQSVDQRDADIDKSHQAQQLLFDMQEADSWMMDKEIIVRSDKTAKDELGALAMLRHHDLTDSSIADFANTINELKDTANILIPQEIDAREEILTGLTNLDESYDNLQTLAEERRRKLNDTLKLHQFNREVEDLDGWLNSIDTIAKSKESGNDYERIETIKNAFEKWSDGIKNKGDERITEFNRLANELIENDHSDSVTITDWRNDMNDSWQDVLAAIKRRQQLLEESGQVHKYYYVAMELLERIKNKDQFLPSDLGRDVHSATNMCRKHTIFEQDLKSEIEPKINEEIDSNIEDLVSRYPEESSRIYATKSDIHDAFDALKDKSDWRRIQLDQSVDLFQLIEIGEAAVTRLFNSYEDLDDLEPGVDVVSNETSMHTLNSIKLEIDGLEEQLNNVHEKAEEVLERGNYAKQEIIDTVETITEIGEDQKEDWHMQQKKLLLFHGVYKFNEDVADAENWFAAQDYEKITVDFESLDKLDEIYKEYEEYQISIRTQQERINRIIQLTEFERTALEELDIVMEEREELQRELHKRQYDQYLQDKEEFLSYLQNHIYENRHKDIFAERWAKRKTIKDQRKAYVLRRKQEIQEKTVAIRRSMAESNKFLADHANFVEEFKSTLVDERDDAQSFIQNNFAPILEENEILSEERTEPNNLPITVSDEVAEEAIVANTQQEVKSDYVDYARNETDYENVIRNNDVDNEQNGLDNEQNGLDNEQNGVDNEQEGVDNEQEGVNNEQEGQAELQNEDEINGVADAEEEDSDEKIMNKEDEVEAFVLQSTIYFKHDLIAANRKSDDRSWKRSYAALEGQTIVFYKDKKHMTKRILATQPSSLSILHCHCTLAVDYKKRKHVFRLRLADGNEYLIQVGNTEEMHHWMDYIIANNGNEANGQNEDTYYEDVSLTPDASVEVSAPVTGGQKSSTSRKLTLKSFFSF